MRGEGLMLGLKCRVPNAEVVKAGYGARVLVVPAADNVVRLLPPLNLTEAEAEEGLRRLEAAAEALEAALRHFLDIDATPADELRAILAQAGVMKAARAGLPRGRAGRRAAAGRADGGADLREAVDPDAGQLRRRRAATGRARRMVLSGGEMQLGHGETIADTARVLSRFVDLVMIRTFEKATLQEMAGTPAMPVINGLTDASHPCQIMADVMTYEEHRGPIARRAGGLVGDGNNVCASFLHAAGQFGFDFVFTGPPAYDPAPEAVAFARGQGCDGGDRARPGEGGGRAPTWW